MFSLLLSLSTFSMPQRQTGANILNLYFKRQLSANAFKKNNMKIRTYRCLGGKVRAKRPWRQLFFWHYGGNEYYMEEQSQWYICEAIFWWIPCEIYGSADVDTAEVKIYEKMRKIVVTRSTTGLPLVKKTVLVQSTYQILYVYVYVMYDVYLCMSLLRLASECEANPKK